MRSAPRSSAEPIAGRSIGARAPIVGSRDDDGLRARAGVVRVRIGRRGAALDEARTPARRALVRERSARESCAMTNAVERGRVEIGARGVEYFRARGVARGVIALAHPASAMSEAGAAMIAARVGVTVVCVHARGVGGSDAGGARATLDEMIDDVEAVREALAISRWTFWGMSGGGWLAQLYGRRYPRSLEAVIVESACVCFRERLADPACALSPRFPAWRSALEARGMFSVEAHERASAAGDAEWCALEGVGEVWRRRGGPALLVSPAPVDPAMRAAMPVLWGFDARDWIASIDVPALVIAGSADPIVPVDRVREVHDGIAGSRFVVVEGGHVPSAAGSVDAIGAVRELVRRWR